MPPDIPQVHFAEIRLIVAKAILDFNQNISGFLFAKLRDEISMSDMLIISAVFIGQAEGRPLTSSDIAGYISLPRSTVIRRIKSLGSIKSLRNYRHGNRLCFYFDNVNSPEALESFKATLNVLKRVVRALSSLDIK